MCDDDGCTLQIYLWNGSTAWNLAFDEPVKSYRFGQLHGHRLLQVVMAGPACDKPSKQDLPRDLSPEPGHDRRE